MPFKDIETPDTSFLQPVEEDKKITTKLKILLQDPDDWHAWHSLGVAYGKAKMYDMATSCYENSVLLHPGNASGYYNLACNYQDVYSDLDKAESYFRKAIEINPSRGYYAACLGRLLAEKGERNEALKYMHLGAEVDPGDEFCNMTLGFYLLLYGYPDQAIQYAEKAISQGEIHISSLNKAHVHLIRGEEEEAIEHYARSLRAFPSAAYFWSDYDSDYELMPQYGVTHEQYDALKPLIEERLGNLPALQLNEIAGLWNSCTYLKGKPLDDAMRRQLKEFHVPQEYIDWLSITNSCYDTADLPHPVGYVGVRLMNFNVLEADQDPDTEEEGIRILVANGFIVFAAELVSDDSKSYVFDTTDGSVRQMGDHVWINFHEIFEGYYETELNDGKLDLSEVYEDSATKQVYRTRSKYVRQYIEEKAFTGLRFNSFKDFLMHHVELLNQ